MELQERQQASLDAGNWNSHCVYRHRHPVNHQHHKSHRGRRGRNITLERRRRSTHQVRRRERRGQGGDRHRTSSLGIDYRITAKGTLASDPLVTAEADQADRGSLAPRSLTVAEAQPGPQTPGTPPTCYGIHGCINQGPPRGAGQHGPGSLPVPTLSIGSDRFPGQNPVLSISRTDTRARPADG